MECPVDKNMEITATTNAKWYGGEIAVNGAKESHYHANNLNFFVL